MKKNLKLKKTYPAPQISLSATSLRKNLFKVLEKIQSGVQVMIEKDGKVVARLIPSRKTIKSKEIPGFPKLDHFNNSALDSHQPANDLAKSICARFSRLGGVDLELPKRGKIRPPPNFLS